MIDRLRIIKAINAMALATYTVRSAQVTDYVQSLASIAALLARAEIDIRAKREVYGDVVKMIREYAQEMMASGKYDELAEKVRNFKLVNRVFDTYSGAVREGAFAELALYSDDNIERQFKMADLKLGGCGFTKEYARCCSESDGEDGYKIDCILFAADEQCLDSLRRYAKDRFHLLNDRYRRYLVDKDAQTKAEYDTIVMNGDPVSKRNLVLPEFIGGFAASDGKDYQNHLYADEETGLARIKLNFWEEGVLALEQQRNDFACWIRNQANAKWALCVPYVLNGQKKGFYPDFLIVRWDNEAKNGFVVDILEPHGQQLSDSLAKAKGLAEYAADEDRIGRVQMIRMVSAVGGIRRFIRLDLGKGEIREKVLAARNDDDLCALFDKYGFFGTPWERDPMKSRLVGGMARC